MVTQTDIANRALQHCGAERIQPGAVLTEDSKNASEVRACYDLTRRAELRRNTWRFSTRRTAIRPIDSDTKFVTFGDWDDAEDYVLNDIVTGSDGVVYISKADSNTSNDPTAGTFNKWSRYFGPLTASQHPSVDDEDGNFYAGELVYVGADMFLSLISGNEDVPPSSNWMEMTTDPTLSEATFIYPIGSGPLSQSDTKQVYRLPAGYVMIAPQNPKAGSVPILGTPSNEAYRDWEFEGDYLLTQDPGVLVFRFIADIADPDAFDPMFVEGFACRIALSVCEPITQSGSKLSNIGSMYEKFMKEARIVNGVEKGAEEQEIDSLIACRY